ncbi:MAG: hypothetical protein HY846_03240 [Nitrosomonadales bacterium]|nr:hypothetical protein [Nitrosomonadales bacterium]
MKNSIALDILGAGGTAMTRRCVASGAGMAVSRLLPQSAGYAITSDLASVVGSPSRMASSSTSNVSEARHPHVFPIYTPAAVLQPHPICHRS